MTRLENLSKMSLEAQLGGNGTSTGFQPIPARQVQQQTMQPLQPQEMQGTGMASVGNASKSQIKSLATACGYVFGYIAPLGPQLRMQLKKTTKKKTETTPAETTYSIVATEAKPTKPLRVLAALPKGICMKDGRPASPEEIFNCNIDYNGSDTDLAYFCWQNDTAVAYIGAVGNQLPEYAPTHTGDKQHYSPKDILANKVPNMGYVQIVSRQSKNLTIANGDDIKWSLKSTARRTLYTPNNFVPLKQLEHISTKCNSVEDARKLNNIAFGSLGLSTIKGSSTTRLQLAFNECPQVIYKRKYTIVEDGNETVEEGIGSIYFMYGETDTGEIDTHEKDEKGNPIMATKTYGKTQLSYIPWYATSAKGSSPETKTVTQIVNKDFQANKSNPNVKRPKNIYIELAKTYGDNKYNKIWNQYKPFIDLIAPCISIDELKNMKTRDNKRNNTANAAWSADIQQSFLKLTKNETVMSDHEALAQKYATDQLRQQF